MGVMENNSGQKPSAPGKKITITGFFVNLFLAGFKLVCGILGNSQALIADAVHSVSDLFTDMVVLVGLAAGRRTPDERHHFGHGRMETLASSVVSLFLAGAGIGIGIDAGFAIYRHTPSHPSWVALIAAGISIVLKEVLFRYTIRVGKRIKSKVVIANAWHHRSDAWSSVAVFAGVAGAQIHPGLHVLDAYAALLVSFFILKTGAGMFWSSIVEFTDTAPDSNTINRISECIGKVPGVLKLHDLKVRTSADLLQMQVHIVVAGDLTVAQGHGIARQVEKRLFAENEDVIGVVVHVDPDVDIDALHGIAKDP